MTKTTVWVIALSVVAPCLVLAQETPPKEATPKKVNELPRDSDIVQAINLTHAAVEDVAEAIRVLNLPVRVAPASENRLLVRGAPADVKVVLEQVVGKVDTPASATTRSTVEYIPLSHASTETIVPLLEAVAPGPFGRHFALDPASNLLVVNAPADTVATIRKLVQTVDKPAESLHMHFLFLRAKIGTSAAEPTDVPKELVPAVKALQQSGFSNVTLVAPVGIHARDGARFESQSTLNVSGKEGQTGDLRFELEGTPHLAPDGTTVQLNLHAVVSGRYAAPPAEQKHTWFELKSSIAAKLDSYVILAAAPSSTTEGDAIVLAVRVSTGSAAGH